MSQKTLYKFIVLLILRIKNINHFIDEPNHLLSGFFMLISVIPLDFFVFCTFQMKININGLHLWNLNFKFSLQAPRQFFCQYVIFVPYYFFQFITFLYDLTFKNAVHRNGNMNDQSGKSGFCQFFQHFFFIFRNTFDHLFQDILIEDILYIFSIYLSGKIRNVFIFINFFQKICIDILLDKYSDRSSVICFFSLNLNSAACSSYNSDSILFKPAFNSLQISAYRRFTHFKFTAVITQFFEFFFFQDLKDQAFSAFFPVSCIIYLRFHQFR